MDTITHKAVRLTNDQRQLLRHAEALIKETLENGRVDTALYLLNRANQHIADALTAIRRDHSVAASLPHP
jgi:uncharacterized protein (DUF1778 family)